MVMRCPAATPPANSCSSWRADTAPKTLSAKRRRWRPPCRTRRATTNLQDTELFAPQDGVVLTRVHEIGAVVQGGQTVYTVTLNNPVWIRAYVTQPNLGNIRPGQEVLLSIDATPDKTYRGRIGFISPTAEFTPKTVETKEVRNDLVFRFRVIADDPDNVMRQGMPVTVTLRKDGGKP